MIWVSFSIDLRPRFAPSRIDFGLETAPAQVCLQLRLHLRRRHRPLLLRGILQQGVKRARGDQVARGVELAEFFFRDSA